MKVPIILLAFAAFAVAQEPDQLTSPELSNAVPMLHLPPGAVKSSPRKPSLVFGPGVKSIDSIVNFTSSFNAPGVDSTGKPQAVWPFSMVGNNPEKHRTTTVNAPIIPVSVLLLNYDGTPRYVGGKLLYSDATQFVTPLLKSPVFEKRRYSSSEDPTQFTDAVQRAEFIKQADDDWHTLMAPVVKTPRLMLLPRGSYTFSLNADGSCCRYILVDADVFGNLLFPPTVPIDGTTVIGAAELAGDITTKDLATFLFPNTFLFLNGTTADCCVLGYHSYDLEPGAGGGFEKRFVMNYSSWISPGIFTGTAFQDITATSHEIAEIYNDPFLDNVTPWWLAPNGNCQNDLETGDVVEGLTNASFPITMNGMTYHPQNEALLQWFAFKSPSNAIHHAYSYPDINLLTSLSAPQKVGCK